MSFSTNPSSLKPDGIPTFRINRVTAENKASPAWNLQSEHNGIDNFDSLDLELLRVYSNGFWDPTIWHISSDVVRQHEHQWNETQPEQWYLKVHLNKNQHKRSALFWPTLYPCGTQACAFSLSGQPAPFGGRQDYNLQSEVFTNNQKWYFVLSTNRIGKSMWHLTTSIAHCSSSQSGRKHHII